MLLHISFFFCTFARFFRLETGATYTIRIENENSNYRIRKDGAYD